MALGDYLRRIWLPDVTKTSASEFNRMEAGIAAALGVDYVTGVCLFYDPATVNNPGSALATFGDANVGAGDRVLMSTGPTTGIWVWNGPGVPMTLVRAAADMPRGHHITHIPNGVTTPLGLWLIYSGASARILAGIEPWQAVGPGTPYPFNGTWVNYGTGGHATTAFRRDANGLVTVKGLVKSGVIATPVFTLPSGYRPPESQVFTGVEGTNAFSRLDVAGTAAGATAGQVVPVTGNPAVFYSLASARFYNH